MYDIYNSVLVLAELELC